MTNAKWPTVWLMTDERLGEKLWTALDRLPPGGGVVLRHYEYAARAALAERIAQVAQKRALVLAVGGDAALAEAVGAQLVHNPREVPRDLPTSRAVHSLAEADAANKAEAALAFVSPLFPTRSHPDATALSTFEARAIVERLQCPAIALGGLDARRFASLEGLGFYGWAGIDAWVRT